jgi:hypothetical protein
MLYVWFSLPLADYASLIGAVVNGLAYGLVVWLVFVLATRKLDESGVADYESKKRRDARNSKRRSVKR